MREMALDGGSRAVADVDVPVSELREVGHSFGSRKLFDGVSLAVRARESVAVVGPSGGGKTTLLSCMLGLVKPSSGEVLLAGEELSRLSRAARARLRAQQVGVVFQHGELVADLTAEENVALPALLSDHADGALDRARRLLEELGVRGGTSARDLSGGETQRTALARALINEPALVVADEPTGSLDTELRATAAELLFSHAHEHGCALVVVTHDPGLAARADRVYRLDEGRLHQVSP